MKNFNLSPSRLFTSLALLTGLAVIAAALADSPPKPDGGGGSAAPLRLNQEDHIAIIGNTLADRLQFDGWLEALIQAKFADNPLVFRNLARAGDEVVTRHRSENFGTPDEWLTKVQADVIFAFFGFNESFKGNEGLAQFKAELDKFLKESLAKNYSGKGPPRIVLFSPIASEKTRDPNLPDPAANNENLRKYTAAMAEVAKANGVLFVDLFTPSQKLYADAAKVGQSLTINGLHLSEAGSRQLAPLMFQAIFGEAPPSGDVEKLRGAINEKNAQWHARYRTVDGYNVYGGRSMLAYQPGKGGFITDRNAPAPYVSNYRVMQEEMSVRDVMTANRDKVVWAAAHGKDAPPDDSNLPPVEKVQTNHPGANPDGSHVFLGGEEAIAKMTVAKGCKVNLFASEEQFPELIKPLQMAWDTKGRLWVSVWRNYPERTPDSKVGDSILIFEDTKGTGHADKVTHYIDDLNCPTGFQFYKDGILLMEAPDLWYVHDTTGGDHANAKERVLMGMDSADSHHTTNALAYDPGGAVYLSDGVFHRTQVETADGPIRNNDAAIYRFEPRTGRFETYISYNFANPHGKVFDYWGNDIVTDATGNNSYFAPAFSGHIDYPAKHPAMKQFWERPSRPCPGTGLMTSRHFPEEFWNNFLNCNVISFQGIYRVKMTEDGSGLHGETLPDLVSSSDPNFRPSAVDVGPDGAIYFLDWQNSIIGHMQHHLRDPNRDHQHGRIYRITCEGRPLETPARIDGQPMPALLELLKDPENQIRERAKIELGKHDSSEVIAAVKKWIASLDKKDPAYEHHMTEALWVDQWHNVVDGELLRGMLRSPEPRARAAATRVLCCWRDRVPNVLSLLKAQAMDENPRVRLEAVRAASFFRSADAAEVALAAINFPMDYYLNYTLGETIKQLEPAWRKAINSGEPFATDNPAGLTYLIRTVSTAALLKLPQTPAVLKAILSRSDAPDADRNATLAALAKQQNTTGVGVLLSLLEEAKSDPFASASIARLLPIQPADDLKARRDSLLTLATSGGSDAVRFGAWAAIIVADGSIDPSWARASKSPRELADLLSGIPLIFDQDLRGTAYDKVKPLLAPEQPPELLRAAIRAAVSIGSNQPATFTSLVKLIEKRAQIAPAIRGLRALPRASWDPAQSAIAASSIVAWAKTIPAARRTTQDYVETVQFAGDLAGLLPAEQATALRKELKELRVAVFVVNTVREQMRYDTPRLVVEAGKPFEVIVENSDFMPHNFVIVKPGARPAVGAASALMKPDELDRQGRAYVPGTSDILAATKLLDPGKQEAIKLTAPLAEGDYDYVCTYPGHWEAMWGRLVVTKDVDAYLEAHPVPTLPNGGAATHDHSAK